MWGFRVDDLDEGTLHGGPLRIEREVLRVLPHVRVRLVFAVAVDRHVNLACRV